MCEQFRRNAKYTNTTVHRQVTRGRIENELYFVKLLDFSRKSTQKSFFSDVIYCLYFS